MKLSTLLDALPDKRTLGSADPEVTVLCYDSRSVHEGALFVAVPGLNVDGHDFIPQAVDKGASVVVAQEDRYRSGASWVASLPPSMPVALVPDSRRALALIAAAFYGHPARRLKVVGITGTDGKTTTTFLTSALLEAGGHKTGFMSTVAIKVGSDTWHNESGQTTQEAPEVQELLARMSAADVGYAVVETSSHALALDRVTGCEYDVAVVTNVSSDHLDFHGTQEEYLRAKARLFRMVGESMDKGVPKVSVLNADDKSYGYLAKDACGRVITYGIQNQAQVMAKNLVCQGLSSRFTLVAPEGQASVSLPMPGEYNVYNCLAAVSVALSQGVSMKAIKERLEAGVVVPGRMERVDVGQPFNVSARDQGETDGGLRLRRRAGPRSETWYGPGRWTARRLLHSDCRRSSQRSPRCYNRRDCYRDERG
ncbi:MAG: UDP-N-acetylmuramyl-tripeptide synthetase [Dehalococcoidia bacterium]|nr:UDP-N-acetylmuramyl-tripeptide synthetase [Dehalococcoidia bacterium]